MTPRTTVSRTQTTRTTRTATRATAAAPHLSHRLAPSVRGNHPAGRALVGPTGEHRGVSPAAGLTVPVEGVPALRLVRGSRVGEVGVPEVRAAEARAAEVRAAEVRVAEPAATVLPLHPRSGTSGGAPGPAPLRLTRRGRRVVLGVVVAGGVALATLAAPAVVGDRTADVGLALAGESNVVVRPGDTLWSIAGSLAPQSDPREVVDALRAANDLDGVALVPGQVLVLP